MLDSGAQYRGFAFGAQPGAQDIAGEITFTTDMFGYERELCSPEREGQILVFATPQVGNVGWTGKGAGDGRTDIAVAALIIRDLSRIAANQEAKQTLEEELINQHITGLVGVDTRKLVRELAQAARAGKTVRGQIIVDKQEA